MLAQAGVEHGDTGQPGSVAQVCVMLQGAACTPYCLFDATALQQEIVQGLAHSQGHIVGQHKLHAKGIGHALAYQPAGDITEGRPVPGHCRATTVEHDQEDVGSNQAIGEIGSLDQIGAPVRLLKDQETFAVPAVAMPHKVDESRALAVECPLQQVKGGRPYSCQSERLPLLADCTYHTLPLAFCVQDTWVIDR